MNKLVSIVLPVYNGERYLAQSIESVLNQTYRNFELIIVNDCSLDSTEEIVLWYASQDNRITYIKNEVNSKLPASLNYGFSRASGEYYTWTSDDNIYHPDAIEKMVLFLDNHPEIGLVSYGMNLIDENGTFQQLWAENRVVDELIFDNNVGACFLYRASVAIDVGLYRTDLFLVEDYEFWLRIYKKYQIAFLPDILYDYRIHSQSLTTQKRPEVLAVLWDFQWGNFLEYEKMGMPQKRLFSFFVHILSFAPKHINRNALRIKFELKHPFFCFWILKRKIATNRFSLAIRRYGLRTCFQKCVGKLLKTEKKTIVSKKVLKF